MDRFHYSGGFLYNRAARKLLLHHRGADAPSDPDKWDVFGGRSEDEDRGDPVATWCREMREELGVDLESEGVIPVCDYVNKYGRYRYVFYHAWPSLSEDFVLGEGQGYAWFTLDEALTLLDLTDMTRHDLLRFGEMLGEVPP
ncbi:MAG: NUDIX domain-containing protein [Chloroflexota bacterium]|nr:NUDIX domain-containing protein [Chloroflexota bacterium]